MLVVFEGEGCVGFLGYSRRGLVRRVLWFNVKYGIRWSGWLSQGRGGEDVFRTRAKYAISRFRRFRLSRE